MKFLIMEPSSLPIVIPLGPKYVPQNSVFQYQMYLFTVYKVHQNKGEPVFETCVPHSDSCTHEYSLCLMHGYSYRCSTFVFFVLALLG
jgi:hypothetical protein